MLYPVDPPPPDPRPLLLPGPPLLRVEKRVENMQLRAENAQLRVENAQLRAENRLLQRQAETLNALLRLYEQRFERQWELLLRCDTSMSRR